METQPDASKTRRRPYVTTTRFVLALLFLELFLFYSERHRWFDFNNVKGWTTVVSLAVVLSGLLLLVVAMVVGRLLGRPIQFYLRTVLVLTAIIAVGCSWLVYNIRQADRQRMIVQAAGRAGSGVFYDYNESGTGGMQFFTGRRPGVTRLHAWLGDDFFHDVVGASTRTDEGLRSLRGLTSIRRLLAHDSQLTDAGMQAVASFPHLEQLDLRDAKQISDEGLKHLVKLSELQVLMLRRTGVSDAGMINIRDLQKLEILDLGMTPVTGNGLKQLAALTQLKQLSFWGNRIDDESLTAVRGMTYLQILDLGGAAVSDAGLENLKELSQLEFLGLRGSQITDAGIQRLGKLQNLRYLDLFNTPITDASVEPLARFRQLETLHLGATQMTSEGVTRLQGSIPNCKITR